MLIHSEKITKATQSGTFSENFRSIYGMCHQIVIRPVTETTTYSFKIMDSTDTIVFERTSETGTYSELTEMPMRGTYTLTVYDATADETFICQIIIKE